MMHGQKNIKLNIVFMCAAVACSAVARLLDASGDQSQ